MALQLTIIKFPPGIALGEDRRTLSAAGARIGRGQDNDWVLNDPERFLSSKHCQVVQEGESYYLVDLSTNGTFVNGSSEPLGRGKRVALNDGDSFDVGEYRFKVNVTGAAMGFPDDPFKDSPSQLASGKASPFGDSKDVNNNIFMSNQYGGEINDIAPDEFKVTDPLQAIDNAQKVNNSFADPLAESGSPFGNPSSADNNKLVDDFDLGGEAEGSSRGSQHEGQNRLTDALDWPQAKPEAGLLPDDWGEDISILNASAQPSRRTSESPAENRFLPDDDSLILNKQARPVAPGRRQKQAITPPAPRPKAAARERTPPPAPPPVMAPPSAPTPRPSNAKPPSATEVGSLIGALGIDQSGLSEEQLNEINATVGVMMRETLEGLMQILRSRASIKNEFRINITTIQPVENNPIKFSANVDEIIELMFVRRTRAYKEPVEAMRESFNTIADHQLAMIAGIRSAFRAALGKFDPIILQEEFKQTGTRRSGIFKGSMWNAYEEYYQGLVNDMERSFHELFGDEFVHAYEDQLRKLALARKRDAKR